MSTICYGGKLRMRVDKYEPDYEYPLPIPKVYIEAYGDDYYPRPLLGGCKDSVAIVRDKSIMEYAKSTYFESLAEDEQGNIIWLDGRTAPDEGCWGGKYLDEHRFVQTYSVVEYDLESLVKRTYKVTPEAVSEFDVQDVDRIKELCGEKTFCSNSTIQDCMVPRPPARSFAEFPF